MKIEINNNTIGDILLRKRVGYPLIGDNIVCFGSWIVGEVGWLGSGEIDR